MVFCARSEAGKVHKIKIEAHSQWWPYFERRASHPSARDAGSSLSRSQCLQHPTSARSLARSLHTQLANLMI